MNDHFPAEDYNKGFLQLRSGLTIYPSQDRAIDALLGDISEKVPARFILLADISGQIISVRGDRSQVAEPVALGSLVAGDLAASREIARLLGEYRSYQMVLREGTSSHTFIVEAGPYMVMLIQVASDVPLGWARMVIRQAAEQLAAIVDALPEELKNQSQETSPALEAALDGGEDISDLFGDALNSLWSGESE